MYTGTLIEDLMAAVDRAERRAEREQMADEQQLHVIFAMDIPLTDSANVFMGAA